MTERLLEATERPSETHAYRRTYERQWQLALGLLLGSIALATAVYWDTAAAMAAIWWRSETYAHGLLIVPIAVYLAWRRWPLLRQLPPRPAYWGVLAVLAMSALWLMAEAARVLAVAQLALLGMIPALVLTLLGWRVVRIIAFPLFFLLFAVPVGEGLIGPLMDFTAWFTVQGLKLTGIPVFWEGRFISIPSGDFEVAEACSGLRYLIASVTLGLLYAYLSYRTLWRRVLFVALAVVVPIIANGIRAYGIVMLAHLSDMRLAVGVDHLIYGWLFFGLVMLLLFWIGSFWREPAAAGDRTTTNTQAAAPAPARAFFVAAAFTLPAIIAGSALIGFIDARGASPATVALAPPVAHGEWRSVAAASGQWQPRFRGATATVRRDYLADGQRVRLFIAVYARQEQEAELINSRNSVLGSGEWRRAGAGLQSVAITGDRLTVRELELRQTSGALIWYWYDIAGQTTTDPAWAKALEAWARISAAEPSAVVALSTDFEYQPNEARSLLTGFLQSMYPAILQALGRGE
jgi:exosortase A